MVQKCFDPRSDSQRWGPVTEDDCEVGIMMIDMTMLIDINEIGC